MDRSPGLSGCSQPTSPACQLLLGSLELALDDIAMNPGTVRFRQLAIIFTLFGHAISGAGLPAKAESHGKKPIAFSGQVKSVNLKLQTVEIRHGPIPGYMPAMTMDYPIDDKALLKELKPDDEIAATVYVGNPVLHEVHVLSSKSSGEQHR